VQQSSKKHAVTKVAATADVRVKVEFVLRNGRPQESDRGDRADFPVLVFACAWRGACSIGASLTQFSAETLMSIVRIALADSQPVFRYGLKLLLDASGGLNVLGEASDGAEAVDLVRRLQPDLILIDVNIRGGGLDTIKTLAALPNPVRSLLLMDPVQPDVQAAAMRGGARGVLAKGASMPHFVQAIRGVMGGNYWLDGQLLESVPERPTKPAPPRPTRKFRLTQREMQVVAAVADGETNKGIAERFRVSEDTVKHHLSSVFDKVGVSSRLELAIFAFTHGLVMLQDGLVMIQDGILPPV
jgi:two-component system nitrate/nitrite response regulator NarL